MRQLRSASLQFWLVLSLIFICKYLYISYYFVVYLFRISVGQSARHVDIGQGQPGGIRKLVLSAILCNGDESREISIRLYVDGGCGAAELVLQPEDIASLNLAAEGLPMADTQSKVTLQRYEQVTVKFETQIGETWRAILTPVCIVPVETAADDVHGVTGEEDTSRLLGYCGLHRMGLKQDFAHHRLIKVLRRI